MKEHNIECVEVGGRVMIKKSVIFAVLCLLLLNLCSCKKTNEEIWDIEQYEGREDIINIEKLDLEKTIT